ncbi:MAG: acyl-CoA dehydratase activase [Coriobacteriales bacterium]|jgi:predicted CoA-substrate-specific enzyme activase
MSDLVYVCKYTPVELLAAYGAEPRILNEMRAGFDAAEQVAGPNICGFGKTVLESVLDGDVRELALVNCCDTLRSVHDVLEASGELDFCSCMDLPRCGGTCSVDWLVREMRTLGLAYGNAHGTAFDEDAFRAAFDDSGAAGSRPTHGEPYVAIMGARLGDELYERIAGLMPIAVRNVTCVNNRSVAGEEPPTELHGEELLRWYAERLIAQEPCMRMVDGTGRLAILEDPDLRGIIYHGVKFCDFYSLEYRQIMEQTTLPTVKIESDYTTGSAGQLATRIESFAEMLMQQMAPEEGVSMNKGSKGEGRLFAGIDSGSTSTEAVIVTAEGEVVATAMVPTGAGSTTSAERALAQALDSAGLAADELDGVVSTGYGRAAITREDGSSVTEITCHARGAHHLNPAIRTIIDIGGQDSKVIRIDDEGHVIDFAMNDKCAAGTGRFLEMMAHTLQLDIDEMARRGISYGKDIVISSTCSVFAESEVISLIAQNVAVDDIVHGLNKSVAARAGALAKRVRGQAPYMMTGGVSRNRGLVLALEKQTGEPIEVPELAQYCGALGAALIAAGL